MITQCKVQTIGIKRIDGHLPWGWVWVAASLLGGLGSGFGLKDTGVTSFNGWWVQTVGGCFGAVSGCVGTRLPPGPQAESLLLLVSVPGGGGGSSMWGTQSPALELLAKPTATLP